MYTRQSCQKIYYIAKHLRLEAFGLRWHVGRPGTKRTCLKTRCEGDRKLFYLTTLPTARIIWRRWQMNEIGVWRFCGMTLTGGNHSTRRTTRRSAVLPSEIPKGLLKNTALHKDNKKNLDEQKWYDVKRTVSYITRVSACHTKQHLEISKQEEN